MEEDRLYLVAYDVADAKRWRRIFRLMNGYGQWLQLSVFQCRLNRLHHAELIALVTEIIKCDEDHVIIVDIGPAKSADPKVVSLGNVFKAVERGPVIV